MMSHLRTSRPRVTSVRGSPGLLRSPASAACDSPTSLQEPRLALGVGSESGYFRPRTWSGQVSRSKRVGEMNRGADNRASAITGVLVVPLRRIPDERGTILHMLNSTDEHFQGFGEIYFTTIYRGVVKGWHKHAEITLNYACIFGRVKLALYDDREDSPTNGSAAGDLPRPRRPFACRHSLRASGTVSRV